MLWKVGMEEQTFEILQMRNFLKDHFLKDLLWSTNFIIKFGLEIWIHSHSIKKKGKITNK